MKRKYIEKQAILKASPENIEKFIIEHAKLNFSKDGFVCVSVTKPNGDKTIQLFKVDQTLRSYDEWYKILSANLN